MNNCERTIGLSANAGHDPIALQSLHARGTVDGLMLRMKLRQVYRNTTGKDLETLYAFPLAWGTTLLGMHVELNGKALDGCVVEKSEAEAKYEQAFEDGDLPVMLVREGKDLYSARIGNLKDGDEALIEIEYGQLLAPDRGYTRITLPTTIAPRFGQDPGLRGLPSNAIGAIDPEAEYPFFLAIDIRGPLAHGRIACPSHAVSQQTSASGISVQLAQQAMLDRDFILTIEADEVMSTIASPDPDGDGACTMLTSFVPTKLTTTVSEAPLRLKLLVDCSGSMVGDSMRLAREALATVARRLRPDDTLSFSRFGSQTQHVFNRLVPASKRNLSQLLQDIGKTEADMGGTELASALKQVIALTEDGDTPPDTAAILLITDGEVWAIEEVIATARHSGHQVYVIGVGSSPAESLVRELAEVTGGAAEFAARGEDMALTAQRLVEKMRSMREFDVEVEAGQGSDAIRLPRRRYRIADGETLHLWYQMSHRPAESPRIVITDRHRGEQRFFSPNGVEWNVDGTAARIGAAQRLHDISDPRRRLEIALKYQLVTEQTNFLLVHRRAAADKATGIPELQQVPSMLAAGWGGFTMTASATHATYDAPRFMRRQAESVREQPPVWRIGEKAGTSLYGSFDTPPLWYTSLAEAIAYSKEPANPLKLLARQLEDMQGDTAVFSALVFMIGQEPRLALLQSVLDELDKIAGDREAAIALLLDWVRSVARSCLRLSRGARKQLEGRVAKVSTATVMQARAWLDAELARSGNSQQSASHSRYSIPAFLRRLAG